MEPKCCPLSFTSILMINVQVYLREVTYVIVTWQTLKQTTIFRYYGWKLSATEAVSHNFFYCNLCFVSKGTWPEKETTVKPVLSCYLKIDKT